MLDDSPQVSKVEQTEMGELIPFRAKHGLEVVKTEPKRPSPNRGKKYQSEESPRGGREHLTESEMNTLLERSRKDGRNGHRNYCIILLMYRHGLRVGEAAALRWASVNFEEGSIYIKREKGSKSGTHPLTGEEIRALRRLQRESPVSPFLFVTSKASPMTTAAIAAMIQRLGEKVFPHFPIHSHMLRHSCGYYLANKGIDTRTIQDYLGHVNIQHTVRYTEISPTRFKNLWD